MNSPTKRSASLPTFMNSSTKCSEQVLTSQWHIRYFRKLRVPFRCSPHTKPNGAFGPRISPRQFVPVVVSSPFSSSLFFFPLKNPTQESVRHYDSLSRILGFLLFPSILQSIKQISQSMPLSFDSCYFNGPFFFHSSSAIFPPLKT